MVPAAACCAYVLGPALESTDCASRGLYARGLPQLALHPAGREVLPGQQRQEGRVRGALAAPGLRGSPSAQPPRTPGVLFEGKQRKNA